MPVRVAVRAHGEDANKPCSNKPWLAMSHAATLLSMQKRAVLGGRPSDTPTFEEGPAKALGTAIRERRLGQGLAQDQLAYLAHVDRSYMGKVERGVSLPSVVIVMRLAGVLGCRPSDLFIRMEELIEEAEAEGNQKA